MYKTKYRAQKKTHRDTVKLIFDKGAKLIALNKHRLFSTSEGITGHPHANKIII